MKMSVLLMLLVVVSVCRQVQLAGSLAGVATCLAGAWPPFTLLSTGQVIWGTGKYLSPR